MIQQKSRWLVVLSCIVAVCSPIFRIAWLVPGGSQFMALPAEGTSTSLFSRAPGYRELCGAQPACINFAMPYATFKCDRNFPNMAGGTFFAAGDLNEDLAVVPKSLPYGARASYRRCRVTSNETASPTIYVGLFVSGEHAMSYDERARNGSNLKASGTPYKVRRRWEREERSRTSDSCRPALRHAPLRAGAFDLETLNTPRSRCYMSRMA
ncbi:unnamed protein product, partial [Iphiclides podalirius]